MYEVNEGTATSILHEGTATSILTHVYCFICTFLSPTTTKIGMMEEQHVLALPYGHVDVTTNMSHDQHLWLLFHFYKSYNTHV